MIFRTELLWFFVLVPLQQISAKFFGVTEKKRIFSIYREYKIEWNLSGCSAWLVRFKTVEKSQKIKEREQRRVKKHEE